MLPKIEKLIKALKADSESRSASAIDELVRLKEPSIIPELLPWLFEWTDAPTASAERAIKVLSAFGERPVIFTKLMRRLKSRKPDDRIAAAWALSHSPYRNALPALKIQSARDSSENAKVFAFHALKALAWAHPDMERKIVDILLPGAKSSKPGIRRAALECLSHLKDPRCGAAIAHAANDADPIIKALISSWKAQRGPQ